MNGIADEFRNPAVARKNRLALAIMLIAAVISVGLLFLPCYSFNASVYAKKSGNTFKDDEKYVKVLEEVEQVAADYRAQGMDVSISENFTVRTNSKGEETSMVAFSVDRRSSCGAINFIGSGFDSSRILLALLICVALGAALAYAGTAETIDVEHKALPASRRRIRALACWLILIALILVLVFAMSNTYTLSRRTTLYTSGLEEEGKEEFYRKLDDFVFDGMAGDKIESLAGSFTYGTTLLYWMTLPSLFVMLLSAIMLCKGSLRQTLLRGLLYLFVIVVCVIILYPYYVMLITGFRSNAETTDMYFRHIMPVKWVFGNLKDIVDRGVLRYLLNSVFVSLGATIIALLCGIPAAYALSRMRFKGKKVFLGFVIMSQMFSPVVLLIGISQLMNALHLNDSLWGLMLINAAFNQAFAIWLLRGTFSTISPEMEQAACIDGCSRVGSLIRVLLPMAAPGIVTTLIFIFINAWNEYTISTVLISTPELRPITVGITQFSSFNMIEWQYLFAASLMATIPVVILFMFIEKHLVSGLTAGGVKG